MKLQLYILFFILLVSSVIAENSQTVYVHLSVINEPPEVLQLTTSGAVEGSSIRCDTIIEDDGSAEPIAKYKWYRDDILLADVNDKVLPEEFFEEGDVITCAVIPNDLTQDGEEKRVSITVKPKPLLSAITGAVVGVGEGGSIEQANSILILVLLATIVFSVIHFIKRK
ncbi:MAG: hypothetical protein KKA79_07605 [Nanoarchaeota archaeon]|nr:hypothetical protein [Nanoarchaeota archaeon]